MREGTDSKAWWVDMYLGHVMESGVEGEMPAVQRQAKRGRKVREAPCLFRFKPQARVRVDQRTRSAQMQW